LPIYNGSAGTSINLRQRATPGTSGALDPPTGAPGRTPDQAGAPATLRP